MPSTTSPPAATRFTLGIDHALWDEVTRAAGLNTEREQAEKLRVSRGFLNRVRNGKAAPGPEFIAQVRIAFPAVDTDRLFPTIKKAS